MKYSNLTFSKYINPIIVDEMHHVNRDQFAFWNYFLGIQDIGNFFPNLNKDQVVTHLKELIELVKSKTGKCYIAIPKDTDYNMSGLRIRIRDKGSISKGQMRRKKFSIRNRVIFPNSKFLTGYDILHLDDIMKIVELDFQFSYTHCFGEILKQCRGAIQGSCISPSVAPFWASRYEYNMLIKNARFPKNNNAPFCTLGFQDDIFSFWFALIDRSNNILIPNDFYPGCILEDDTKSGIFLGMSTILFFVNQKPQLGWMFTSPNERAIMNTYKKPSIALYRYGNGKSAITVRRKKCTIYGSLIYILDHVYNIPNCFIDLLFRIHTVELVFHKFQPNHIYDSFRKLLYKNMNGRVNLIMSNMLEVLKPVEHMCDCDPMMVYNELITKPTWDLWTAIQKYKKVVTRVESA